MSFLFEASESRQWPSLQAEHNVLEKHLQRYPQAGHLSYLEARVADPQRKVALYYVKGIGMGDGRKFAMVCECQLVWFSVLKVWGHADPGAIALRVGSVMIPEALNGRRDAVEQLFEEALLVYENAHGFAGCPTRLLLDCTHANWSVIPTERP